MAEIGRLLDGAADGRGGVLAFTGPPGSGRTELAAAAAREGARRGFTVLRTAAISGQPGALAWARLLADAGAPDDMAAGVLDDVGPLAVDRAARALTNEDRRLLVIDDIDHGGTEALQVLQMVAARVSAASTAVVVTSVLPPGVGTQLRLTGLSEDELAAMLPGLAPRARHGVWLASGGLPGAARSLAADLAADTGEADPLVCLALTAPSRAEFLDADTGLIRLLELALPQAQDDSSRARLLAKLARELLADSSAGPRRRALTDEAVRLARRSRDPGVLAEVLDARLHALWDPGGAEDRLAAASEIIGLSRAAGDDARERQGMFWRFVALMELARMAEAESALATFGRAAAAACDGQALVMATARQAMLATLRGRFDEATQLIADVAAEGRRAGLPDTDRLVGTLHGQIAFYRGPAAALDAADQLWPLARRLPGHFMEASIAAWLALTGRAGDAQAELDRVLPAVLTGSGPRQLGSAAALAFVAVRTGDLSAAAQLRDALLPYRGRLAVFGGAAMCLGPVSLFLGLLATQLGLLDEAVRSLREATAFAELAGALPCQALSLQAAARALSLRQAPGDAANAAACRERARAIAGRLGMSGTLSRWAAGPAQWSLRRDGEDWLLQAGPEHARLRDSRGLHYLRSLLAAPGSDVRALDLVAELAAADRAGDSAAADKAHGERVALVDELRRATGLAGRPRRAAADAERARVNVTRTLRAAIDRITRAAPVAGTHLSSSIRTGTVCRYQPVPGGPARWHT
jgi:tetratricopeptide (TPR) repeat protein